MDLVRPASLHGKCQLNYAPPRGLPFRAIDPALRFITAGEQLWVV